MTSSQVENRIENNLRAAAGTKECLRLVVPPVCVPDPLVERLLAMEDRNFFIDHAYRAFLGRRATPREILFHARCLRFLPRFFTREKLIEKLRASPQAIAYQLNKMANRLNNLEMTVSDLAFSSGVTAGYVAPRADSTDSRP